VLGVSRQFRQCGQSIGATAKLIGAGQKELDEKMKDENDGVQCPKEMTILPTE